MALTNEEEDKLRATLAELGGKNYSDEDIAYEGTRLVVPIEWKGDLKKAVHFLQAKIKEDDEVAVFARTYNYRPWDGAYCAYQAMRKLFGMVQGKMQYGFLGREIPPAYIQIPISATETAEVPWGRFQVPLLTGANFYFDSTENADYGEVFSIRVEAPRKYRFHIEGLFELVKRELEDNSIYRGKAVDGQEQPQFLDLTAVDENRVVYSEQVKQDLSAHVWAALRYTDQHKQLRLPLKRAVLMTGPYGTGKSLAGYLTAREAVMGGWTFIMARPGRDDFLQVMQTARLYQPAVVFFEDAETMTGVEQSNNISRILDVFDGVQAKGTNLMVIMTTNHPETIHKGMLRPGRVDAVIEIGALDDAGIEKLIRAILPEGMVSAIDFEEVARACKDYVPAFVKEVADRASRYALARSQGALNYRIGTADLVFAANGLRPQWDRMNGAGEEKLQPVTLQQEMKAAVAELASKSPNNSVWNKEELTKARNRN